MTSRPVPAPWLAVGVLGLAVVGVGFGAIFARLAGQADPLVIAAYRVSLAWLMLLPWLWPWRREALPEKKLRRTAWVAGVFLALHFAAWISSLFLTSVAASVLLVNTAPVWVALLSAGFTDESPGKGVWLGILLSLAGAAWIVLADAPQGAVSWRGNLLAVAGAMAGAVYLVLGRRLRGRMALPVYTLHCYGAGSLVLWLVVWAKGAPVAGFSASTWWALLAVAAVSQVVGHTGANFALRHIRAPVVSVVLLGETVISALAAWAWFAERPSWTVAIGGLAILAGLVLAVRARPATPASPSR